MFGGGGVRGGGRPKGFGGGGGCVNDDVDAIKAGRPGRDALFPFSARAAGIEGCENSPMTAVCCSRESFKESEGW